MRKPEEPLFMERIKQRRNAYAGIPTLTILFFECCHSSRSDIPRAPSRSSSFPISSHDSKKFFHI